MKRSKKAANTTILADQTSNYFSLKNHLSKLSELNFSLYLNLFIGNGNYVIKSQANHTLIIKYTHLPSKHNCEWLTFLVNI